MKEIPLSQGEVAIVDDENFEHLNQFKWFFSSYGYAVAFLPMVAGKRPPQIYMHRSILPGHAEIDHINGDRIDNRKSNLRPATHAENAMNSQKRLGSSRYKGVSWCESRGLWEVQLMHNKRKIHAGRYESEVDAAHVYDYAAKVLFGEFARINFP